MANAGAVSVARCALRARRLDGRNLLLAVDAEGNQLPYIDGVVDYMMPLSNADQIKLRILSGEVDWENRVGTVVDIPLYQDAAEAAGISINYIIPPDGAMQGVFFAFDHSDPKKRELIRNADFRRALSLSMDRETINETPRWAGIRHGFSWPASTARDRRPLVDRDPTPPMRRRFDRLNQHAGLPYLSDGSPLAFTLFWGEWALAPPVAEVSTESWREIGLRATATLITREILFERLASNTLDAWLKPQSAGLPIRAMRTGYAVHQWAPSTYKQWQEHKNAGGAVSVDIPEDLVQILEAYDGLAGAVPFTPDYEAANDRYRRLMAEGAYVIGTVQNVPNLIVTNASLSNVPGSKDPTQANVILGSSDEEIPVRALYYAD